MPKFPHYKQLDAMDCGPTCLRIVAKYYGKSYSLQYLRSNYTLTMKVYPCLELQESQPFLQTGTYTQPNTNTAILNFILKKLKILTWKVKGRKPAPHATNASCLPLSLKKSSIGKDKQKPQRLPSLPKAVLTPKHAIRKNSTDVSK